ncbi:MAG: alpha/beta fold hydrolase [Rhodobacteraceae bacterium]|nr:alpha/beta fold hydrolase [Paracoccaceae bacterium]
MPDLALPDVSLHYEATGSGPPLLLLAGMMSDGTSWAPLLPLLSQNFTLIYPDNRTTGRTTPWDAPASLEIYAQDALALMRHLGHARFHIAGHSLGGLIGLQILHKAPERVIDLSLLATAPMRLRRNISLFENFIAIRRSSAPEDTWLRALFPWLFSTAFYDTPGAVDEAVAASLAYPFAQSTDAMVHQLSALSRIDIDPLCGPYPVPVQALLAEKDQMIPLDQAQSALAGADIHTIADAGHSVHWDAPQEVAALITRFAKR